MRGKTRPLCGTSATPQADQIASPKLAIQRDVEERELACVLRELQPDADRPDLLQLERVLLTDQPSFVPRLLVRRSDDRVFHGALNMAFDLTQRAGRPLV